MSEQTPSSSKSTPKSTIPGQGKTKVFILSPDILKKLGIVSKISNLNSDSNPVNELNTITLEKDNVTKSEVDLSSVKCETDESTVNKNDNDSKNCTILQNSPIKLSNVVQPLESSTTKDIIDIKVDKTTSNINNKNNETNIIKNESISTDSSKKLSENEKASVSFEKKSSNIILSSLKNCGKHEIIFKDEKKESSSLSSNNLVEEIDIKNTNDIEISKIDEKSDKFSQDLNSFNQFDDNLSDDKAHKKNTLEEKTDLNVKQKISDDGTNINKINTNIETESVKSVLEIPVITITEPNSTKSEFIIQPNVDIKEIMNRQNKSTIIKTAPSEIVTNINVKEARNKLASILTEKRNKITETASRSVLKRNLIVSPNKKSFNPESSLSLKQSDNIENKVELFSVKRPKINIDKQVTDQTAKDESNVKTKLLSMLHYKNKNSKTESKKTVLQQDKELLRKTELDEVSTNFTMKNKSLKSNVIIAVPENQQEVIKEVQKYEENLEEPVEKKPRRRGRKRKVIIEEEPVEISPIRKSSRKKRLSTIYSDYVTDLKLHDGSSQMSKKHRKSTEIKLEAEPEVTKENEFKEEQKEAICTEKDSKEMKSTIKDEYDSKASTKKNIIIHENILIKSANKECVVPNLFSDHFFLDKNVDSTQVIPKSSRRVRRVPSGESHLVKDPSKTNYVSTKGIILENIRYTEDPTLKVKTPARTYSAKVRRSLSSSDKMDSQSDLSEVKDKIDTQSELSEVKESDSGVNYSSQSQEEDNKSKVFSSSQKLRGALLKVPTNKKPGVISEIIPVSKEEQCSKDTLKTKNILNSKTEHDINVPDNIEYELLDIPINNSKTPKQKILEPIVKKKTEKHKKRDFEKSEENEETILKIIKANFEVCKTVKPGEKEKKKKDVEKEKSITHTEKSKVESQKHKDKATVDKHSSIEKRDLIVSSEVKSHGDEIESMLDKMYEGILTDSDTLTSREQQEIRDENLEKRYSIISSGKSLLESLGDDEGTILDIINEDISIDYTNVIVKEEFKEESTTMEELQGSEIEKESDSYCKSEKEDEDKETSSMKEEETEEIEEKLSTPQKKIDKYEATITEESNLVTEDLLNETEKAKAKEAITLQRKSENEVTTIEEANICKSNKEHTASEETDAPEENYSSIIKETQEASNSKTATIVESEIYERKKDENMIESPKDETNYIFLEDTKEIEVEKLISSKRNEDENKYTSVEDRTSNLETKYILLEETDPEKKQELVISQRRIETDDMGKEDTFLESAKETKAEELISERNEDKADISEAKDVEPEATFLEKTNEIEEVMQSKDKNEIATLENDTDCMKTEDIFLEGTKKPITSKRRREENISEPNDLNTKANFLEITDEERTIIESEEGETNYTETETTFLENPEEAKADEEGTSKRKEETDITSVKDRTSISELNDIETVDISVEEKEMMETKTTQQTANENKITTPDNETEDTKRAKTEGPITFQQKENDFASVEDETNISESNNLDNKDIFLEKTDEEEKLTESIKTQRKGNENKIATVENAISNTETENNFLEKTKMEELVDKTNTSVKDKTHISEPNELETVEKMDEEEKITETKTPKRKRGRPKKSTNISEPNNLDNGDISLERTVEEGKLTESIETQQKGNENKTASEENATNETESENILLEKTISKEAEDENDTSVKDRTDTFKPNDLETVEEMNEEDKITETKTPKKKRGRPKKSTNISEPNDLGSVEKADEENKITETKKHKGRKGRPTQGTKRKREDSESNSSTVTCAVCNEELPKNHWNYHVYKHNFLCWKVGEEPIDLNNRKAVEYVLNKAIKNKGRFKFFTCPHCDDKKKSVAGFLAHLDFCQLTEEERIEKMLTCTICDKKVMPQSMRYHMNAHDKEIVIQSKIFEESCTELDSSRSKRKAAAKAAQVIQEVAKEENNTLSSQKKEISGKKTYKKATELGSVFMTNGIINKLQMEFKNGSTKCRFNNCSFEAAQFEDLKIHLNSCPALTPEDYICRFCMHTETDLNLIKKHIKNNHSSDNRDYEKTESDNESIDDEDDDDDDDDEEIEDDKPKKIIRPSFINTKPVFKIAFLIREKRMISKPISTYLPALRWTQEFRLKNYSAQVFNHIKCLIDNIQLLTSEEKEKYIPCLKKSMSVKNYSITRTIPNFQQREHEWKEFDLYESTVEKDTVTIFCGGPVWSIAWTPTPLDQICNQYLAVSFQKNFGTTYKISESPSGNEIIQFWNFGPIRSNRKITDFPVLEFSLAHDHGMVWCMEWCPSGFYDTEAPKDEKQLKKLGLLALACSDGTVPIYAIGIPNENSDKNIYKMKPVFKLILQDPEDNLLGQWKYQATKISWSKSSGHDVIAGGFTNGMVCLWNLSTSSPLLKSEENGVIILKPFHSFQAHTSAISALVLYPTVNEGRRWLLTGSWDRGFKYWDLNNTCAPISIFGKRGIITDGVWLSHWLCSFISYDDVFSPGHTVTTVQNPRDFGYKQTSALPSNSVVMSLSANDWASGMAQANYAGELIAAFPRAILISYDADKHLKCKRLLLSYNELVDKTKDKSERKDIMKSEKEVEKNENEEKLFQDFDNVNKEVYVDEPSTYEKAREKYGLLFCDFNLENFNALPEESLDMVRQSRRLREVPTELYPLTSLNRIAWNPNKQAYLYIACGYQNGFVRLRCVKFMNLRTK